MELRILRKVNSWMCRADTEEMQAGPVQSRERRCHEMVQGTLVRAGWTETGAKASWNDPWEN